VILGLDMPYLDPTIRGGTLAEWHKQEGESVTYGEDLCTISVHELVRLRRDNRASSLTRRAWRAARRPRAEYFVKGGDRFVIQVKVISSDRGFLRKVLAQEGTSVGVGDRLALLTTDPSEPLGDPGSSFRAVGSLLEYSPEGYA
jgi:hypothetical protein